MCIRNGGMLTGAEIEKQIKKGKIGITPYDPIALNPNSYNLKLHPQLLVYARESDRADVLNSNSNTDTTANEIELILELLSNRISDLESKSSFQSILDDSSKNSSAKVMKSIKNKSKAEKFKKFDNFIIKSTDNDDKAELEVFHENKNQMSIDDIVNNSEVEELEDSQPNYANNATAEKTAFEYIDKDASEVVIADAREEFVFGYQTMNQTINNIVDDVNDRVDSILNKLDALKDSYNKNINGFAEQIENEFNMLDDAIDNIDKKIIATDTARKQAITKLKNEVNKTFNDFAEKLKYSAASIREYVQSNYVKKDFLKPLDMMSENKTIELTIPEEGIVLKPGVLYIGRTVERTWTDKYIPMINGRSSGGRLGISVHVCAGFGDIGFDGTWTLEITVVEPVRVYPNTDIAQVCFFKPYGKVGKLYRGRYYKQEDATASRFYKPKEDI